MKISTSHEKEINLTGIIVKQTIKKKITEEERDGESEELQGKKGGIRSLPFIIGNEILEKVAGGGLGANMIRYLHQVYHMSSTDSSVVLQVWGGFSNILPIFGAYLSDAYLGRFRVITIGCMASLIGNTLLLLTTMIKCDPKFGNCKSQSATPPQLFLLFTALAFMSIGSGGIKPCTMAFGADQLSKTKNKSTLQNYFNFYYASVGFSFIIAISVIVPIQDKKGWKVGYFIPVVLSVISVVMFLSGSSLYIKVAGNKSLMSELWKVIKKTIKNHHVKLPPKVDEGLYLGSQVEVPSEKLRFLNKACMISNKKDSHINPNSSDGLCTIEQVENLKSVLKTLPIWSASIIVSLFMVQNFQTLQAERMNCHVFPWFQIPPASFGIFSLITMTLCSSTYNRLITPFGVSNKQRIGIGIIIGTLAMAVSAVVENYRRRRVINSARWLIPQFALLGLAEAFAIIGQIEFYYSELPKSMNSFGVALFSVGVGVANMFGALIIKIVKKLSTVGGRRGWLPNELNEGRYDYYYWVIAGFGVLGFIWFVVCSRVYGEEGKNKYWENEEEEGDSQVLINNNRV